MPNAAAASQLAGAAPCAGSALLQCHSAHGAGGERRRLGAPGRLGALQRRRGSGGRVGSSCSPPTRVSRDPPSLPSLSLIRLSYLVNGFWISPQSRAEDASAASLTLEATPAPRAGGGGTIGASKACVRADTFWVLPSRAHVFGTPDCPFSALYLVRCRGVTSESAWPRRPSPHTQGEGIGPTSRVPPPPHRNVDAH